MWERNPDSLLVELQTAVTTPEISRENSQKVTSKSTLCPYFYHSLACPQRTKHPTLQMLAQPWSLLLYSQWLGKGNNLHVFQLINE